MRLGWRDSYSQNIGSLFFQSRLKRIWPAPYVFCDRNEAKLNLLIESNGRSDGCKVALQFGLIAFLAVLCDWLVIRNDAVVILLGANKYDSSFPVEVANHLLQDFFPEAVDLTDPAEESDRLLAQGKS